MSSSTKDSMVEVEEDDDGVYEQVNERADKRSENFHAIRQYMQSRSTVVYNCNQPDVAMKQVMKDKTTLIFSSDFESGNLSRAIRMGTYEYDLEIRTDTNARGSAQWYNFSVTNAMKGMYTFNIINFVKAGSLYNHGLRPCYYSRMERRWRPAGEFVCYFENNTNSFSVRDTYVLSFSLALTDPNDVCYVSYCYPFTFTDLGIYLNSLEIAAERQPDIVLKRKELCLTVERRSCEMLKIYSRAHKDSINKVVVVTARVHPGEANSSWVVKGLIDYLVSSTKPIAKTLLANFRFVIVPMLNPDGVVMGNYRCDSGGFDLNRQWKTPDPAIHPTIHAIKAYMKKLQAKGKQICFYFDLHGHSAKKNVFMYGNSMAKTKGTFVPRETASSRTTSAGPTREGSTPTTAPATGSSFINDRCFNVEKVVPHIFSQLCPRFAFTACTYHIAKRKEGTARVVCGDELGVLLAYTLETSFVTTDNNGENVNFSLQQYQEIGVLLLEVLHKFIVHGPVTGGARGVADWIRCATKDAKDVTPVSSARGDKNKGSLSSRRSSDEEGTNGQSRKDREKERELERQKRQDARDQQRRKIIGRYLASSATLSTASAIIKYSVNGQQRIDGVASIIPNGTDRSGNDAERAKTPNKQLAPATDTTKTVMSARTRQQEKLRQQQQRNTGPSTPDAALSQSTVANLMRSLNRYPSACVGKQRGLGGQTGSTATPAHQASGVAAVAQKQLVFTDGPVRAGSAPALRVRASSADLQLQSVVTAGGGITVVVPNPPNGTAPAQQRPTTASMDHSTNANSISVKSTPRLARRLVSARSRDGDGSGLTGSSMRVAARSGVQEQRAEAQGSKETPRRGGGRAVWAAMSSRS